ncbi:hypothetical protein GW777_06005 [Candidatus Peregrinibacteria bacterium]|nr:hypothetical protein [bacterium]NCQ55840.1 hypothetical protein [Candidatus Parcubacteria bacterium]NCS67907.1 hypothetical protein [Candidatus Peregrinibacteria bacterium]
MIKRFFQFLVLAFFIWVGYLVVYKSPEQKLMDEAVLSQETKNTFTEGFEKVNSFSDLFKEDWSGWHEIIVQNNSFSVRRPIRYCMINMASCLTSERLGNYIEIEKNIRRRGAQSLKFYAAPFGKKWFGDSRAAIRRQLFDFKKDDDIYFTGWFYFKGPDTDKASELQNLNHSLFLSFRSYNNSLRNFGEPGPALFFNFRNSISLRFDNWLPAIDNAEQDLLERVNTPLNEWVEIKMHLKLSDKPSEGLIEVWMNDKKIIAERAKTLPTPNMVYSILEVGIGSNLNQEESQTMYVDNISVSPTRFND